MATYKSQYTGPQIDQAVGNALIKDTATMSNDVNHIPASSVVKSALNTVDESIAIRVFGNKTTYASGAAIGQYVIVDGSTITGIADGLYKAAKAIPYNTAIDSTYLTAVSGGGLNDLKAALDNKVKIDTQDTNVLVETTLTDTGLTFTVGAGEVAILAAEERYGNAEPKQIVIAAATTAEQLEEPWRVIATGASTCMCLIRSLYTTRTYRVWACGKYRGTNPFTLTKITLA